MAGWRCCPEKGRRPGLRRGVGFLETRARGQSDVTAGQRHIILGEARVAPRVDVEDIVRRERQRQTLRFGQRTPSDRGVDRSEEHTSELQSLMRISYAVFCLKKKNKYKIKLE